MNASLRALLAGAIDYAGTFPPASLGLEQAAENFFCYRQSPEAWMLGRFVFPAAQLNELAALVEKWPPPAGKQAAGAGWLISAVLPSSATAAEWRKNLSVHLPTLRDCALAPRIDTVEIRLPDELAQAKMYGEFRGLLEPLLDSLLDALTAAGPHEAAAFVEPPAPPAVPAASHEVRQNLICWAAKGLDEYRNKKNLSACRLASKLRTGGVTAQAFLSPMEMTKAICTLREHGACWKATAGLHHPMFRYDVELGTYAPGFINALVAAVLADVSRLPELDVQAILEDENVSSFAFDEQGLSWRGQRATVEEIERSRRRFLLSFGSCSFDDPVGGLRAFGWL